MSDSCEHMLAQQAPLSMGLLMQEYWSRFLFPFPGDLPNSGIKPISPALHVNSLSLSHQGSLWGRMDTCVWMAESLCCPPETVTTLLIDYVCACVLVA